MRAPGLTRLVFGTASLVLLVAAVSVADSVHRFEAGSTRTGGAVVALRAGGSHPTVEFTDAGGATRRFDPNGYIFGYRPGDRVQVLYEPMDPQRRAALDAVGSLWVWPIMLGAIGPSFVLVVLAPDRKGAA